MHLFGSSSSASASNTTHADSPEHFHSTVIYADGEDDFDDIDYDSDASGYEDVFSHEDDWDTDDDDYGSDSYDDSCDDD